MKVHLLLLLLAGPLAGRATPFDYSLLRLGTLPAHASQQQLVQRWGQPAKTSRPRYECGSHYDEPGKTYYQLHYPQATYIGNAAEGYEIETIYFHPGGVALHYGARTWDASTTLAAVQKLFGADAQARKQADGSVLLSITEKVPHTSKLADSALHLTFRRGRLVSYATWYPC